MNTTLHGCFVIGNGEVGRRIAKALAEYSPRIVTRQEGWAAALDPDNTALRIVCVREEDVSAVAATLSILPRERQVFVQNGLLEDILLEDVGRALIWFTSKGEFFQELRPSVFFHAPMLAEALSANGVSTICAESREHFLQEMSYKLLWNCIVGLPLAVHGCTLGDYLVQHEDECCALIEEGCTVLNVAYGCALQPEVMRYYLREVSAPIHWVRGGKKALWFRNEALLRLAKKHELSVPMSEALYARI